MKDFLIAVTVIVLLVGGFIFVVNVVLPNSREGAVIEECKSEVASMLKYPRSADFINEPERDSNKLTGVVYAQNGFGGMGPVDYECTLIGDKVFWVTLEQR